MTIDWEPLRAVFRDNQRFVLTSHVRPDADALGSELGLARMLDQYGKQVRIVNASPTPKRLAFLDPGGRVEELGKGIEGAEVLDTDVHVVLDTSATSQLGSLGKVFAKSEAVKVVIDHHASEGNLDAREFKDISASATGLLVYELAGALGYDITEEGATALYCAMATDTGWFRFSSTGGRTMRAGAGLIDAGAQPALLYRSLYEQCTNARMHLAGRVLERITTEFSGKLAHTYVVWDDYGATGADPMDTEDLVNECLKIAGVECALIFIEQRSRQIKVSFRSRGSLDVAAIAESFGGGGHKQAAGAMLAGPVSSARKRILQAFAGALEESRD